MALVKNDIIVIATNKGIFAQNTMNERISFFAYEESLDPQGEYAWHTAPSLQSTMAAVIQDMTSPGATNKPRVLTSVPFDFSAEEKMHLIAVIETCDIRDFYFFDDMYCLIFGYYGLTGTSKNRNSQREERFFPAFRPQGNLPQGVIRGSLTKEKTCLHITQRSVIRGVLTKKGIEEVVVIEHGEDASAVLAAHYDAAFYENPTLLKVRAKADELLYDTLERTKIRGCRIFHNNLKSLGVLREE